MFPPRFEGYGGRMDRTLKAKAYGFASTLNIRELAKVLGDYRTVRTTKTLVIVAAGDDAWIIGYDFGALVFVGVGEAEQKKVLEQTLARVGPEPHPPMEETLTIEVAADAPAEARFARMRVPVLDLDRVEIVALVLAQSVAMEYYEEDVDQILDRLRVITEGLARTGRFRGSVREMMRFVGSGMLTRNQVVFTLSLLDTPQLAWSDESRDKLYRALRAEFEIEDRYRALDHKLTMIQDSFELLTDLTQQRRSLVLEVAVAVMVLVEVLMFGYQIWHG